MRIKSFNWKIFFTLTAASLLGVLAVLPYSLALQAKVLESTPLPMPLAILIPIQILENALLFALVIAAGLWAAIRTGLGLPILEDALAGPSKTSSRALCCPAFQWESSLRC